MKIALSLTVYASILLAVFTYFHNGSIVEAFEQLGAYLNAKVTQ